MRHQAQSECPQCGADVQVAFWTEEHRVHNGIGMQTVARDRHAEITGSECDCEWTEEKQRQILESAE